MISSLLFKNFITQIETNKDYFIHKHSPLSSPTFSIWNRLSRSTAALFDRPSMPVGVPVAASTTLGLE
jgi:hypothetical protein